MAPRKPPLTPEERERKEEEKRLQRVKEREERRKANREAWMAAKAQAVKDRNAAYLEKLVTVEPPADVEELTARRPTQYREDLAEKICETVALNSCSTQVLCEHIPWFPRFNCLLGWRRNYPEFHAAYNAAKQIQADVIAEECLDIANTPIEGEKSTWSEEDGLTIHRADMIEHRRLMIETRKWFAAQTNPNRYGRQVQVTGGENVGLNAAKLAARTAVLLRDMTQEEAAQEYQQLMLAPLPALPAPAEDDAE